MKKILFIIFTCLPILAVTNYTATKAEISTVQNELYATNNFREARLVNVTNQLIATTEVYTDVATNNLTAYTDTTFVAKTNQVYQASNRGYFHPNDTTGTNNTITEARLFATKEITADYTATINDSTIICNGVITITLPPAADSERLTLTIKNAGTDAVTIDACGAETIDDELTLTLTSQYNVKTIQSDGTTWWILN